MNNETITEKYLLCMLKEKKITNSDLLVHVFASMIIEMMLEGNLEITEKNKIKLTDKVPTISYYKELYDIIKAKRKDSIKIKDLISDICYYTFTEKKLKSIITPLKQRMEDNGLITIQHKKIIFIKKEKIIISNEKFNSYVEEIRAELLEEGKLTDEIILLAALLDSTKFLKNIFTKYEKETINKQLKEIKDTPIGKNVKIAQDVITEMLMIIIAAAA